MSESDSAEGITACAGCTQKLVLIELVPKVSDVMKKEKDQDWYYGLHCDQCKKCPYMIVEETDMPDLQSLSPESENGAKEIISQKLDKTHSVVSIDEILKTKKKGGWFVARNNFERLQAYILNNAIHTLEEPPSEKSADMETLFALPYAKDQVWLNAVKGKIVGFAVLKLRGSQTSELNASKQNIMDIIDAVFIRKSHRRKGHCTILLETLLERNSQGLAVSKPLSNGFHDTVFKFLTDNEEYRRRIFSMNLDSSSCDIVTNFWAEIGHSSANAEYYDNPYA